jgi:IclR family transcriptional regulator, acetate operon repressor
MLSSVGNALRVLEELVEAGEAGVSDVARALGLTVGTTHRLIGSLVEAGFAEQNAANRKYRPGAKIPILARRMRAGVDFGALAHGQLELLGTAARETVNLGVLRDREVVYVDRVAADQPLTVTVRIGSRVPAFCTGLGKALLAFGPDEEREAYERNVGKIAKDAGHARPDGKAFSRTLDEVRRRGYATDDGEFAPDIACVAAPILGPDQRAIAAVSISGLRTQIQERQDELKDMVQLAAKEISDLAATVGDDVSL